MVLVIIDTSEGHCGERAVGLTRLQRKWAQVVWLIAEAHFQPTEVMLAITSAGFGAALLWNPGLFISMPAFAVLAVLVEQWALAAGLIGLAALSLFAFHRDSFELRRLAALIYSGIYAFIGVTVGVRGFVPLVVFSFGLSMGASWAYLRMKYRGR